MKVFCLFSRDKDVCVKVVILAKINKCDTSARRLVWLFGSSRWGVNRASGCTAATMSPLNVSSWKPGVGGTSQLFGRLQDSITFHTMHKNWLPSHPLWLPHALSASVCSPLPFCALFPFLFLPSPLPVFWRYTHTLSGACSSWPLLLRHFLWRLWRPTFGPINTAFLPFSSNIKWNAVP